MKAVEVLLVVWVVLCGLAAVGSAQTERFGFEFECGVSQVTAGPQSLVPVPTKKSVEHKDLYKCHKAYLRPSAVGRAWGVIRGLVALSSKASINSAGVPTDDVRETLDTVGGGTALRLEYVVGGPGGFPLNVQQMVGGPASPLCRVLSDFAGVVWRRLRKNGAWDTMGAYDPTNDAYLGDVQVALPPNAQCSPQITFGIPHDALWNVLAVWALNPATAQSLRLFGSPATSPVHAGVVTLSTEVGITFAAVLALGGLPPAVVAAGVTAAAYPRAAALVWFVKRYVRALNAAQNAPATYTKQHVWVLLRTNFAALATALTTHDIALLDALHALWNPTVAVAAPGVALHQQRGTTVCRLAFDATLHTAVAAAPWATTCGQAVDTITPGHLQTALSTQSVLQWVQGLFGGNPGIAGVLAPPQPYNAATSVVVVEFRHPLAATTHINTMSDWVWHAYDSVARHLLTLQGPAGVAAAAQLPPPVPLTAACPRLERAFLETATTTTVTARSTTATASATTSRDVNGNGDHNEADADENEELDLDEAADEVDESDTDSEAEGEDEDEAEVMTEDEAEDKAEDEA